MENQIKVLHSVVDQNEYRDNSPIHSILNALQQLFSVLSGNFNFLGGLNQLLSYVPTGKSLYSSQEAFEGRGRIGMKVYEKIMLDYVTYAEEERYVSALDRWFKNFRHTEPQNGNRPYFCESKDAIEKVQRYLKSPFVSNKFVEFEGYLTDEETLDGLPENYLIRLKRKNGWNSFEHTNMLVHPVEVTFKNGTTVKGYLSLYPTQETTLSLYHPMERVWGEFTKHYFTEEMDLVVNECLENWLANNSRLHTPDVVQKKLKALDEKANQVAQAYLEIMPFIEKDDDVLFLRPVNFKLGADHIGFVATVAGLDGISITRKGSYADNNEFVYSDNFQLIRGGWATGLDSNTKDDPLLELHMQELDTYLDKNLERISYLKERIEESLGHPIGQPPEPVTKIIMTIDRESVVDVTKET